MNILITGANQGIGYYMTEELLERGNNVTVLDLETDGLNSLKERYSDRIMTAVCDVRNAEAIRDVIEASVMNFGTVDIAVHNACRCTFDSMEKTDFDTYRDVFEVNYFGALQLTRAVIPYMKKAGRGKIMFTSSGVGVMGFVNISPYASSKGAIESLAKCLNIEYQHDNISFHILHPPLTKTKSSEPLPVPGEFMADPKKVGVGLARNINKKRFIICHSFGQKAQTMGCYLFPVKMGRFMSKMTANYEKPKPELNT